MDLVYFIHDLGQDAIKIGCTGNLARRLPQHWAAMSRGLRVLGAMPGWRDEEREVHRMFRHLRLAYRRTYGHAPRNELFHPATELLSYADRLPIKGMASALLASNDCPCDECDAARESQIRREAIAVYRFDNGILTERRRTGPEIERRIEEYEPPQAPRVDPFARLMGRLGLRFRATLGWVAA